jgi:hypothetical protein
MGPTLSQAFHEAAGVTTRNGCDLAPRPLRRSGEHIFVYLPEPAIVGALVLRDAERAGFDLQGSVGQRQRFCRQQVERLVRHDLVVLRAEHAGKDGAPWALRRNDEQVLLRGVRPARGLPKMSAS